MPGQIKILFIPVTSKILFIPGHFQDSVYTRSFQDSVYTRSFQDSVYIRWCSFTQTSVRGAASAWAANTHQSSDCDGVCVAAFVTLVSWAMTLVGTDWYRRSTTAASGRAASITTRVSGRWARGCSGNTTPGLSLIASPASRVGQVIWGLAGRPEKGLVQGCSREGEERPDPKLFTLEGLAVESLLGSCVCFDC